MSKIRLLIDEDVSMGSRLAVALRRRGYDAVAVQEIGRVGLSDEEQLHYAVQERRTLLSCNAKDFIRLAEKWYFSGKEHPGIVIAKQFESRQFGAILRSTLNLLASLDAEEIRNTIRYLQEFQ
ncbi:MAG: DUF5615 family PIN-like protein [Anaerolineae bacterium]|nr:DUF5615 family PIN-like protein [Anaerolineae bacterium]